jgi:hypothetical protein
MGCCRTLPPRYSRCWQTFCIVNEASGGTDSELFSESQRLAAIDTANGGGLVSAIIGGR